MATDGPNAMFGSTTSGIPLSTLDYGYIGKCTNVSELEKIVKVLRSGDEGLYPELILFAEKQLESIHPKSKVLRKDIPIQSYRDLDNTEREQLTDDFKDWISDINQKDSLLKKDSEHNLSNNDYLPPIRSTKTVGSTTSDISQVSGERVGKSKVKRSAAPREYQDWDKFNPDEELKLLEEKEDRELKIKREQAELNAKEAELPSEVETIGKTDAELNVLADREKDKGNEAFRCGDYRESLVYYSRSINYKPTAASHNNRAFANLKLEKYLEAVEDCNVVVSMEPNNLKAFLRRALAHKNRGEGISAREDLNKVLEIEPNNKRAKELLSELNASKTVENGNTATAQVNGDTHPKRKGKRLKIIEVENDEEPAVVGEEKEIEKNIDESSSSSHESTDGNCLSSSTNGSSPTERSNLSTSDTSEETKTETPIGSDTDTVITPTMSDDSEAQTSNGVVEKGRTEVSASQPVNSSPPLVELPGIVLKAKEEGTSLYKLGRYAEATEKFTMAIEILEKDKSQFLSALSSLLNNRAACLQRIGDASGCVKDCTASLGLIPGSVKPLLKRAASNEMLEKYEQSYLDYNSVIFVDPINQAAMQGKSRVSKHLINMYGSSWRDRLAGVKVSPTPTSSELLNTDDNAAEKSLNILQTKPAPTVNSTTPIAQIPQRKTEKKEEPIAEATVEERFEQCKEKGNSFVKQGKVEQAVRCYTECIELDSTKVAVYTNRALCYLRLEKFILAEEDASKALDLQEDNLKALYRRGLARKALRKYEEAAKDLVNLIKIEPSNASGRKELEIVLNLCREARKAKKKVTNESQPTVSEIKTSEKQNDSKVEPNKATRRRRVQIEEVNSEEDSDQASSTTSSPSVSKKTPDTSSKATKNESIQEVSDKTDKEEAKAKTSPVKEHKRKKIKLHKATAFDFYQAWNSVKQKDLACYADILRQLQPAKLPKVLSNKLDADMFRSIVGTVSEQLLPNGEEKLSFEILQHMCKAQRFDMVMMFLDASDNKAIRDICSKLASARSKDEFVDADTFNSILKKYNV